MSVMASDLIASKAEIFRSPSVDITAIREVRNCVFMLTNALMDLMSKPVSGEGITATQGQFVQAHTRLVESLLKTLGNVPSNAFGPRGWWLVRTTYMEYLQFLKGGKEVIGSPGTLIFISSDADYVQSQFNELYQVLDRAIKLRDSDDESPLDIGVKKLQVGGAGE
jgi:hypothetical protein